MTENAGTNVKSEGGENKPFLGSWATKEAAEEGLANLQSKLDIQGNEVGTLRKQVEFDQQAITDLRSKPAPVSPTSDAPNYDKEIAAVQKEMAELDPADESYQKDQLALMNKSNAISRKAQHEETLTAATAIFKKELDERDVKTTHSQFYKDNPDFNTPEMQMRIKDYIAKDTTGMSDDLVAYREIQRDTAAQRTQELEVENAELKKLVDLAKGTNETGRVITKGQSTTQQQTKLPKATGAELDKGMQGALDALR